MKETLTLKRIRVIENHVTYSVDHHDYITVSFLNHQQVEGQVKEVQFKCAGITLKTKIEFAFGEVREELEPMLPKNMPVVSYYGESLRLENKINWDVDKFVDFWNATAIKGLENEISDFSSALAKASKEGKYKKASRIEGELNEKNKKLNKVGKIFSHLIAGESYKIQRMEG